MKKLLLCFCMLLLLGACEKESPIPSPTMSWNSLGLDGFIINKIDLFEDKIYVGTNKGFYVRNRTGQDADWELIGFENKVVQSFLIINESEMIVSLVNVQDPEQTGLQKTTNGGETWVEYTNGFGGQDGEPAFDITQHPDDASTLYAVGYNVVARSTNGGSSWEPIYGEWGGFSTGLDFVKLNPQDPESIWAGGQNGIEQGVLLHSPDGGESWENWLNLVEAPSVAKEIAFHPSKAEEVYVGFEGGLIKTPDRGEEWETLIHSEENRFFFGLAVHPNNPQTIYAAGWLKRFDEPQPFIIFVSKDGGSTWEEFEHNEPAFGGVYDMELVTEGGKDKLYVGLYKGGVYEVTF